MSCSNLITIRPRLATDIPELIEILDEVYAKSGYPVDGPSIFAAKLQPDKELCSTVALYHGRLAGHVQLQDASSLDPVITEAISTYQPIESYASLNTLFVDPKIQRKGVGTLLVEEALTWSRSKGKRLVLVVLGKDAAAIRMYDDMGWERVLEYVFKSGHGVEYGAFAYIAPL